MAEDRGSDSEDQLPSNIMRATTIGHQTEDCNRNDYLIGEMVLHHNLKLPAFVRTCQLHPHLKDETRLIHQIFLRPDFVQDLVCFLMHPFKMLTKYGLSFDEGRVFVSTIRDFLTENYQFYEYYFLALERRTLSLHAWFQFLDDNKGPTFYGSLAMLTDVFVPFLKYEYSTSSRITEYFQKKGRGHEGCILAIALFPEDLVGKLMQHSQYQAVWKVVLNVILVSLQEQEWKLSLNLLKMLCQSAVASNAMLDSHVENVYLMVKDVSNNIEKDKHNTIFAFTDAFEQTNLVGAALSRVEVVLAGGAKGLSAEEEMSLEYNFKIIAEIINIYCLLRNNGIDHTAGQMVKLKENIQQVCHHFDKIVASLRIVPSKTLNFSNGETIRSSSLYRFEFLYLLRASLGLIKQHGQSCPQFRLSMDKSQVLELLMVILPLYSASSQNRWNNILQCLIEKIVCLMINTEFFKTRSSSIRKFLSFLVQAFSNKKYMFLNSTKMINQGDIHFLYFVSRKITAELDRMPAIVDSTNQYDFWKLFVLNVLQKYEDSTERLSAQVGESQEDFNERDGDLRVEIDEVALIKEIVKKIEVNKKWNCKKEIHPTIYRIGSASELNIKKSSLKSQKLGTPGAQSRFRNSINQDKMKSFLQDLQQETNKEKSMQFIKVHSHEEIKIENSNNSSEELQAFASQNFHSDTEMDEQGRQKEGKGQ